MECRITSLLLCVLCPRFERHLYEFFRGTSSSLESDLLVDDLQSSSNFCIVAIGSLDASEMLYFVLSIYVSASRPKSVAMGAIKEPELIKFFDNPSMAASDSKVLAIWASNLSLVT